MRQLPSGYGVETAMKRVDKDRAEALLKERAYTQSVMRQCFRGCCHPKVSRVKETNTWGIVGYDVETWYWRCDRCKISLKCELQ
jgi:hypothetical protein